MAPDRLRFDFSYNQPLTETQLQAIEDEVNTVIRANTPTQTKIMIPDDALKTGAVALFGEKYGDEVRVVSMGESPDQQDQAYYSIEFCGGTHVTRTGDIGYFKITGESGIAAGIRRIEAQTGPGAELYARNLEKISSTLAASLKTKPDQLMSRVSSLLEERKTLERDIKKLKEKIALGSTSGSGASSEVKKVGHINYLAKTLEDSSPRDLKPAADSFKKQIESGVVVLGSSMDGKASLVVGVTEDLLDKISAVDLVRVGSEALGGKGGGGRPDMAQAGGPDGNGLEKAYGAIEDAISS